MMLFSYPLEAVMYKELLLSNSKAGVPLPPGAEVFNVLVAKKQLLLVTVLTYQIRQSNLILLWELKLKILQLVHFWEKKLG